MHKGLDLDPDVHHRSQASLPLTHECTHVHTHQYMKQTKTLLVQGIGWGRAKLGPNSTHPPISPFNPSELHTAPDGACTLWALVGQDPSGPASAQHIPECDALARVSFA